MIHSILIYLEMKGFVEKGRRRGGNSRNVLEIKQDHNWKQFPPKTESF